MPTLEDAIVLAATAHRGQTDKAGQPYVLHPLRMMVRMANEAEQLTALLHDVVEDTPVTLEDLRQAGYPEEVVRAVDALTRRDGEEYEAFVERAGSDPLARRVKIADLEDNLQLTRIADPQQKDHERIERYRRALAQLVE